MSEHVDIEATVTVEVTIWQVNCKCGEGLNFEATKDNDNDLVITVEAHDCKEDF